MNTHGAKREVVCQREPWLMKVGFWVRETTWSPDRVTRAVGLPLTFRTLSDMDDCIIQPHTFTMADAQAQQFMDELWRTGFRPSEGSGSAGSLAATERHLADMRSLVFKTKPV